MTQAATSAGAPLVEAPVARGFEYKVRLGVAIPLVWAQVLKTTGGRHYDYKCREMAECGVVNGLHNVALLNEDPDFKRRSSSWPSTHPVAWRDCDGMMKILEQAHYEFDLVVIGDIRGWLRRTMDLIEARHHEIAAVDGGERKRTGYTTTRLTDADAAEIAELLRVVLEDKNWFALHSRIREIREKMIERMSDIVAMDASASAPAPAAGGEGD